MKIDRKQVEEGGTFHTEQPKKQPGKPAPKPSGPRRDFQGLAAKNLPKVKAACLVLLILSIVVGIWTAVTYRNLSAEVKAQTQEITDLKNALDTGEKNEEAKEEDTQDGDASGEETKDRSQTDSERAGIFLSTLLTFPDYPTYEEARAAMTDTYHLPADGDVLSSWLPACSEEEFKERIGGGMTFESADSYTVSDDGEKISYFAVCVVTATSKKGNSKTADRVCVLYTLDGKGNFSDVSVYAMANDSEGR